MQRNAPWTAGCVKRHFRLSRLVGSLLLIVAALAPGRCQAQDDKLKDLFSLGGKSGISKPKFTTTLTPADASPGDEVTLSIAVELPKGFYIYSTTGTFDGRTRIELKVDGLEPLGEDFTPDQPAKVERDPVFDEELGKHFGRVTWTRKFRVKPDATAATVTGELTGQYCGGPEAEQASCIPIRPPYRFEQTVQIARSAPVYTQHIRPTLPGKKKSPANVMWDFDLSPTDARPGDKVTLSIKAVLDDGWHIFSLTQSGAGGVPTVIDVSDYVGLTPLGDGFVADAVFEVKENKALDLKMEVHHHAVTWTREFEVTAEHYGLAGEITYQTCKQTCVRGSVKFELGRIQNLSPVGEPIRPEIVEADTKPAVKKDLQGANDPLLPFLVTCFIGGFVALLTPCSFPMVPITVSFFLHQSETQHKRPWLLALVYCGTIVAAFTILGVGIAVIFGAAQLNQLANIGWLNFVIGGVFVVFALNMLGLFELHMPGWLLTMTSSQESTGSYLGAVFMALTFTLTSFTCTFAIAGALLVLASKGEIYRPAVGMLAFGTAFALPFFVLAMIPGLLKKLPKSGGWMNSVKVVMGLLELGAAIKFFSIADPAQVVFDQVTVMLIWFVLALVTAIYLFGWFKLPHDSMTNQISPARMLLGATFFVLAGWLLTGVALPDRGGFAVRQILAFAPARFEVGDGALGPSLNHHGLEFALYLDKAVPVAQKQKRALLLDFTGVNCANCRDMELRMAQPAWKERIAKFIGVQLYVDVPQIPTIHDRVEGEKLRAANEALELDLLEESSMPAYAVVTPDGKTVLARYIGAETKAGSFVKFLDEGWEKWEQLQGKAKLTDREVPAVRQ